MFKKLIVIISICVLALPAAASDKAAEVTVSKGRVEIVHGDAVMGKRASEGAELVVRDILRTKRRGYAEVGFIDGTNVKIFEKSRLTINGIGRETAGFNAELQKGKVLFNVEKMVDVAGDFRVKTTNSVIGVKGTTFGVVSGGPFTIVEVYEGNVEVFQSGTPADMESGNGDVPDQGEAGRGGEPAEGGQAPAANLGAGQGAVLSSSGGVQVYEFAGDGSGQSLIFNGAAAALRSGGSDVFGALGEDEQFGGSADADGLGGLAGAGLFGSEHGDPMGMIPGYDQLGEALQEGNDFYSNPDVKPDIPGYDQLGQIPQGGGDFDLNPGVDPEIPDQIEHDGSVDINIEFE
ncbi:FecR protein [Denitrovibrio acetiphilus DSM 12809]|uniref:FecR protein n=1 Tax=Denitrovibrio acetiphilus (strain DSM 12809 / NBRC 114555 / N2460) TaxID=522772 RepID=D4H4F8_DENA2|nr:FecR family protein [Denitrovibrio acetiphilus]ADD69287.1 FecR protein [Denitrovibrio acetiphilus DSM 12809]